MPDSLGLLQHALLLAFKTSLVLALVAACAGVATSIVLSAFQIQDQALPFAIKLVVVCAALVAYARSIAVDLLGIVDQVLALTARSGV